MNYAESTRDISPQALVALGVTDLAYVKAVEADGHTVFAVHAADGTRVALLPSRELAVATIRRHDMEPVSVH